MKWFCPIACALALGISQFSAQAFAQDVGIQCDRTTLSAKLPDPFKFILSAQRTTEATARIYDAEGRFIRTIAGEVFKPNDKVMIEWDKKDAQGQLVPAGAYTLRVECGFSIKLDKTFAKEGVLKDESIVNPKSIAVDKKGDLFVLDVAKATVHKFHADGSPANDWEGVNHFAGESAPRFSSVAVNQEGMIYMPEGLAGHSVAVFDGKTGKRAFTIGGFFGEDLHWKIKPGGLGWPAFAVLGGDRVYVTCPGYLMLAAFSQNKPDMEGAFWRNGKESGGFDSAGTAGDSDGQNGLYFGSAACHNSTQFFKVIDTGERVQFAYDVRQFQHPVTRVEKKLAGIRGVASDKQGVVYVLMRPTQQILKIVDIGTRFQVVGIAGAKGDVAEKAQFMGPTSLAISPAGDALYVSEDNEPLAGEEPPTGLARVTKYAIAHTSKREFKVKVIP